MDGFRNRHEGHWCTGLFLILLFCSPATKAQSAIPSTASLKVHEIGNVRRLVSTGSLSGSYTGPVCEYPRGEGMENMMAGYPILEIAAIASEPAGATYYYTQWWDPPAPATDSLVVVSRKDSTWIPFTGAYTRIGDEDFVYRARSDRPHVVLSSCPASPDPIQLMLPPMDIELIISNMTWNVSPLSDVIMTRYRISSLRRSYTGLYVSLYFRGGIGLAKDPGTLRDIDDRSLYLPDSRLALMTDGGLLDGVQSSNCVGYRVFPPRGIAPSSIRWTTRDDFSRQDALRCVSSKEEYAYAMYGLLSSGVQMVGNVPGANWISAGPFTLAVGETLEVWTAEILGTGTTDVIDKSALLDRLLQKGFRVPHPPPPPPLRIDRADKSLTIRWDARPGDIDPEAYTDPARWDQSPMPFEGYRVYRSTQSLAGPWTMLYECDIAGDGVGRDFGLQHSYTETGLLNHAEYYYAVTSFSKPDTVIGIPSRESALAGAMAAAIPGEPARAGVGDVAVVPNPYRSDIAYTSYDPPWERPTGRWPTWTESDRRVQFINLPRACVIRIYTVAGDFIEELHHTNVDLPFHDWNLTSYVGQAVASGIYLFTVEDSGTGDVQTGKFVVIR